MKIHEKYNRLKMLGIALIVFSIITLAIKYYFNPFLIIIFMMIITKPIYRFLLRINIHSKIAGAISLLIINIVLFCFIFYFGNEVINFIDKIYKNSTNDFIILEKNVKLLFGIDIDKIILKGIDGLSTYFFKTGASVTGDSILSYIVSCITVYFYLVEEGKFIELLGKLIPEEFIEKITVKKNNLIGVIKIELVLVFITTMIIIVGFKILQIPSGLFLGIICGILDILPYVGTIIVFIPIIIYNIIMKRYLVVVGLVALYSLSQIIREILELKYLSSKLDIHPLAIMISIYIGAKMFGIIGMIVGPIYCLIAKDILYG